MIYALIFFGKLIEVSIATVRIVLTARGRKLAAAILSAIEIAIWLILTSTVLMGISEDPILGIAFGAAFVLGIYLGIIVEDKLALGLSQIECITDIHNAKIITNALREFGFGVTTFDCAGQEGGKLAINLKVHRKDISKAMKVLDKYDGLFVTVSDIRKLTIGNIARQSTKK